MSHKFVKGVGWIESSETTSTEFLLASRRSLASRIWSRIKRLWQ